MNCTYTLRYKKPKATKSVENTYNSDADLDLAIATNFNDILQGWENLEGYLKSQDKFHNRTPIESLLKTIQIFDESPNDAHAHALELLSEGGEIQSKLREKATGKKFVITYNDVSDTGEIIGDPTEVSTHKTLIAAKTFGEMLGGWKNRGERATAGHNTEDKKKAYISQFEEKLTLDAQISGNRRGQKLSDTEQADIKKEAKRLAEAKVKEESDLSDVATKAGDDVHKIMEYLALVKSGMSPRFPTKFQILTDADINSVGNGKSVFEQEFKKLCEKYHFSKDAKFFPEYRICSKYLTPGVQQRMKELFPDKDYDGIEGVIDLLVIDKGKAYIFDYKTSNKLVGDWDEKDNAVRRKHEDWMSSAQIDNWKKQVSLYCAIIKSWGIEVAAGDIVNFHIKYHTDSDGKKILPKYKIIEKNGQKRFVANPDPSFGGKNVEAIEADDSVEKYDPEKDGSKRSPVYDIMHVQMKHWKSIVSEIQPITPQQITEWEEDMKTAFGTINLGEKNSGKVDPKYYRGFDENGRKVREDRIKPIPAARKDLHALGYKYVFYYSNKVDLGYGEGTPIYFNAEYKTDDGKTVDEILEKYCEKLEEVKADQFYDFAQQLMNIMQVGGVDSSTVEKTMQSICGYNKDEVRFLTDHFKRYLNGGWQLLDDPNFINNGVFMFYDNDKVEIVQLTTAALFAMQNYGTKYHPNKTILGHLCDSVEECDPYTTMSSTHGNMLMMRIMALISRNQNTFSGKKIRDIKIINPFMTQATWSDIDYIQDNWSQLCAKSNGKLKLVDKNILYSSTEAAIEQAKEICFTLGMWDNIEPFFEDPTRDSLISLLRIIKQRAPSGAFDENGLPILKSQVGYAYYCIQNALLLDYQIRCPFERDGGKIFEGGIWPVGYYFNNPGRNQSTIVRTLDNITNNFRAAYSKINNDRIDIFQKKIKDIYEDFGFNPNLSTRKKFFEQFFEEENGTVGRQMRIKNFADPFWKNHDKAKKAFMYILDTFAKWKGFKLTEDDFSIVGADESAYELYDSERYYEMPLVSGDLTDYLKRYAQADGIKGITEAIGNRFKQKIKKMDGILFGEFEEGGEDKRRGEDPIQYGSIINNRYINDNDVRAKLTSPEHKVAYSTDLEEIIGMTNLAQALSEASQSYGPVYAAAMASVAAHQVLGGLGTPELSAYINEYVKKVYHGESLIDNSLKLINGLLGFVKSTTSALALKLNTRAFTREMLVSFYNGLAAAGFNKIPGVSAQDFAWGLWFTIKQAPAEVKKNSLVGYLNRQFQLAGQSRLELATANFITDFGLATVDLDKIGYATTTLPDGYYRVGILCAKLHADGAFDAYEEVSDGEWTYNPKKDKRFSKYLTDDETPTFKEYDASMGSIGEYTEAKALWNANIEGWRSALSNSSINVPLQAYTPSEIGGIQEKAEDLYGAFDSEHKSLMCSQFIGSALLQYKTWIASQINRWIKQGGHVNTWQRMHMTDGNGNKLYILSHTADEIAAGKPSIEFVTEDQIPENAVKEDRVMPYIKIVGTYMEGELRSTLSFCDAILHLDMESLRKLWAKPVTRAGLIQGIMDAWGMLLFAGLVKLLFGEDVVKHKSEQNWITQWTYGVLMGFAEDGPVWSAVGSLVQDFNPPALISLQKLARTTKSVILGNKTVPQGVLESMGATREFSGLFAE